MLVSLTALCLFAPTTLATQGVAGPTFGPTTRPLGTNFGVHAHDWNADGLDDLVGSHGGGDQLGMVLSRTDGTFDFVDLGPVPSSEAGVLGTFDSNASPDLALIADSASGTCVHLIRGNGAGQPLGQLHVLVSNVTGFPLEPQHLACGDIDGDGDDDLIGVERGLGSTPSRLHVLLGDGLGGFTAGSIYSMQANGVASLTVADFNQDGIEDTMVPLPGRDEVRIQWGTIFGLFQPGPILSVGNLTEAAAGDFDADGDPEIVVGSLSGPGAALLYERNSIGNWNPTLIPIPDLFFPFDITVADVDGDSVEDVILYGNGTLVLENDGAGQLTAAAVGPSTASTTGAVPDLNGDGLLDHVGFFSEDEISVSIGLGEGQFANVRTYPFDMQGLVLAAHDFDGDGFPELIFADRGGDISTLKQNAEGLYEVQSTVPTVIEAIEGVLCDWDSDGNEDLVVLKEQTSIFQQIDDDVLGLFLGDGAGNFIPTDEWVFPTEEPVDLDVADLNGDGQIEVLVSFESDSPQSFTPALDGGLEAGVNFGVTVTPSLAVLDVDDDGLDDLVAGVDGGRIYLNLGAGQLVVALQLPGTDGLGDIDVADLDGNGDLDIVGTVSDLSGGASVRVFLRDGLNVSGPIVTELVTSQQVLRSPIALNDVDGDGVVDMAFAGPVKTYIAIGLGDGSFESPFAYPYRSTRSMLIDVNADGFVDWIRRDTNHFLAINENLGKAPSGVDVFGTGTAGCRGTQLASTNGSPTLGNAGFAYACNGAPPNSIGLVAGSMQSLLPGVPFQGLTVHVDPSGPLFQLQIAVSDANGIGHFEAPLPSTPSLAGATYTRQFVWAWPSHECSPTPLGWSTSRAVQVTLLP